MLRTRKNKKTTKSSKTKKQNIIKRGFGKLPRSKPKLLLLATASVFVLSILGYSGMYFMSYREVKHAQAAWNWGPRLQVGNGSGLWFQACKFRRDSGYGPLYDIKVIFAQPNTAGWSIGVTGLRNGQRVAQDFYAAGWYNGVAMRSITVSAYLNDQIVIAGGNSRFNGAPLYYEFGPVNPSVYVANC